MKKMRKTTKRISALIVSFVMLLSLFTTVFAADDYTIKITKPESDNAAHKYSAYQIFTGEVSTNEAGEKILINLVYGDGIDAAALCTALGIADDSTADAAAAKINELVSGSPAEKTPEQIADIIAGCKTNASGNATLAANASATATADIEVEGPGYYFIFDEITSGRDKGAFSDHILVVLDNETDFDVPVESKSDVPSLDKVIVDSELGEVTANTASIGDEVPFKLTTAVPEMEGYNKYYFVVNDTLCTGLTYNDDMTITVDGEDLTEDTDYFVTATQPAVPGPTTLKIVFNDFINVYEPAGLANREASYGKAIVITYSATLNDDCDRTKTGNPNTADLLFSNDPNHTYTGTNEPGTGEDNYVGETPEIVTKTYTTGIELHKVDENGDKLTGAEFELTGSKMNQVIFSRGEYQLDNTNGTYWKLKDETYTTTDPETVTDTSGYASTNDKYSLVTVTGTVGQGTSTVSVKGVVDEDGYLKFEGLGAGTYTITETKAPKGKSGEGKTYTFTIGNSPAATTSAPNWTYSGFDNSTVSNPDGPIIHIMTIVNPSGSSLPTTGGIGTVIFYVVGALLIAGAGTLTVFKVRKKTEQQ